MRTPREDTRQVAQASAALVRRAVEGDGRGRAAEALVAKDGEQLLVAGAVIGPRPGRVVQVAAQAQRGLTGLSTVGAEFLMAAGDLALGGGRFTIENGTLKSQKLLTGGAVARRGSLLYHRRSVLAL